MTSNHRSLSISRAAVLLFTAAALAADDTTSEEKVGWKEGPNTRGTLNLVWSCGITTFACTWTVTHLNLPARDDTALRIFLRRVKWMAINIFFPEFILVKAICDLRQALDELRQFDENLPEVRDRARSENNGRSWKVKYPPYHQMLYRLLRLKIPGPPPTPAPAPTPVPTPVPTPRHRDSEGSIIRNDLFPWQWALFHSSAREWTVLHSYYAQMGGILIAPRNEIITATELTSHFEWDADREHPLKYLELSKEDIEDKSKSDWLLKSLAVLQIIWLVLNVAVRAATGLHVTQLEIATVAFAVMAVLTYLASWWKPKDISAASMLYLHCEGRWISSPRVVRLSHWFHSPVEAFESGNSECYSRIPNDLTWMGADGSSRILLLAVSSLVFGSLHCIAWNFEFPSKAELIAWRIGCVIIAVLPATVLAFSALLNYLLIKRFNTRRQNILIEEFDKLPEIRQDQWERILYPGFLDMDRSSVERTVATDSWPETQTFRLFSKTRTNRRSISFDFPSPSTMGSIYFEFLQGYRMLRQIWTEALEGGKPDSARIRRWEDSCGKVVGCWELLEESHRNIWCRFERFVILSLYDYEKTFGAYMYRLDVEDSSYIEKVPEAFEKLKFRLRKEEEFESNFHYGPRYLSVVSYIVYPVARLLTIVIMFTSLRSLPADVYQVTPWVNFLPKVS